MKRPLLALALVACGCSDVTPCDAERLVGRWAVVDFHSPSAAEDRGQLRKLAVVTEGTWSEQFQGSRFEDFEYVVDASKAPKELDLIFTDAAGRRLRVRAIYEFQEEDRVRVCFGTPPVVSRDGRPEYVESVRPTAFTPADGPLVTYRRLDERVTLRW